MWSRIWSGVECGVECGVELYSGMVVWNCGVELWIGMWSGMEYGVDIVITVVDNFFCLLKRERAAVVCNNQRFWVIHCLNCC